MELFQFQTDVIGRVRESMARGRRRVILQLPTGGGKTMCAAELMRRSLNRGKPSIFAAHLDVLVEDTERRLIAEGLDPGRIQAGYRTKDRPVLVCSLQTLHARKMVPDAHLVILDECHRAAAPSVRRIAEAYPDGYVLGLTATPCRSDKLGLGDVFQDLVCGGSVRELIALGRLVPSRVFAPESQRQSLACTIDAAVARSMGKPTVVFTASVDEARAVASRLGGVSVDGTLSREVRRERLAAFAEGRSDLITCAVLLTEGWDCPRAEVCVIARSCGHVGQYLQIVGRVLRTAPGKRQAVIEDLRGWCHTHGLPDDDREWELTHGAVKKPDATAQIKRCPECGHNFRPRADRACPICGYFEPIKPVRVEVAPMAFTTDVNKSTEISSMKSYYLAMVKMADRKGYKPGWASYRFKERYGFWPSKSFTV